MGKSKPKYKAGQTVHGRYETFHLVSSRNRLGLYYYRTPGGELSIISEDDLIYADTRKRRRPKQ